MYARVDAEIVERLLDECCIVGWRDSIVWISVTELEAALFDECLVCCDGLRVNSAESVGPRVRG